MMTIQPGEFWVADIPFTNATASKKRPVLVLWLDGADAVVAAVTTALPRGNTDVSLHEWQKEGLRKPSVVRLSRLDCLEQTLLIGRVGAIAQSDAQTVLQAWSHHVKPQF
ncbi:type II toxin-antitoxin system PemK/MazF family toxin [candidate division KSB1 bacterium]|nr:type II toxin-antitoxin system PemK/MazF family toxin [candidate division KSB1 bacterium]